jgi:hypothetical protein
MTIVFRLGAAAVALASAATLATFVSAQQAAPPAPAAPSAAPAAPAAGAKQPDFSGIWGGNLVAGGTSQVSNASGNICPTKAPPVDAFAQQGNARFSYQGRTGSQLWVTFEQDCGIGHRGKLDKPLYKPQYWQDVRLHDYYADTGGEWADYTDPDWKAIDGVPRMGAPNKIIQTPNEVIFLYQTGNIFRVIPTDCRAWDPVMQYDQTAMGLAVGCFLDDGTLVVKSTAFTDGTWLDWNGYVHSNQMTVTETFKLGTGAAPAAGGPAPVTLIYNRMVEDPVYFLQPWNIGQQVLAKQTDPSAQLLQDVPFVDRSLGNLVDPQYRG